MFVTLWEFEVKSGSEELFERTYGPEGEWVQLFRRDAKYRGTRLLRDAKHERVYVTMDLWGLAGGVPGISSEIRQGLRGDRPEVRGTNGDREPLGRVRSVNPVHGHFHPRNHGKPGHARIEDCDQEGRTRQENVAATRTKRFFISNL